MCGCSSESYQAVLSLLPLVTHYKIVLTFESKDEILKLAIKIKATEQLFLVVLFYILFTVLIILYKVAL